MNKRKKFFVFAALFLIICLCISLAGCADTLNITDHDNVPTILSASGGTNKTELSKGTNSSTTLNENETIPSKKEGFPTKTVHVHNYAAKVVAPSCTKEGYTIFHCDCGDSYSDNQTNATGHSWDSWKITKEPTITAEGAEQRTCKSCGKTDSRSVAKLPEETKPVYETFSGTIGSYNAHNLAYKDWKGDTEQAAFIEVYSVTKSDKVVEGLAAEFEKVYGFAPSLGDKYCCTSSCEKVGTYMVNGYSEPQTVYHYKITDKTYIYITNEMYKVSVQQCGDGSVWVGYCIYATMDTVSTERDKPEVRKLDQEMYATFEDLVGLSRSEMNTYKETLDLKVGYISEAGTVRSAHADGLVDVLYIYCRGFELTKKSNK